MTKCTKQPSFESVSNENKNSKKNDSTQISKLTLSKIINKIFCKFRNKYNHMPEIYEIIIIDNIIYNEKSHIVSTFKDLLIAYDYSDYLKRYYTYKESKVRLPKYFEYYNLYSKIFPNYTSIPEGKYFYLNIQRKQRMIDLQEKMENENSQEKKNKYDNNRIEKNQKDDKVFNTSVVNSILNRTNKEEMEILFDIDIDKIKKSENIFIDKINKLIDLINIYEIKEDYFIDYNYDFKNKNNKNKETISPLMNININYINFNKYNEDKGNSNSINNQSNKNNIFLYKIFNLPMKDKNSKKGFNKTKYNSKEKKDYSLFIMKINQLKKNKRILNNMGNYLKNKYLSLQKNNNNNHNSFINNKSYNSKKNRKNQTIVYDNRNKSLNNNNLILNRNNNSLKNLFSYKSSFGVLSSNSNNNLDGVSKLTIKSPLTSRNKKRNEDINPYLTNKYNKNKYFMNNKRIISPQKDNKSSISKNENNFYNLINNSRNKLSLNNNMQSSINDIASKKYNAIQNSISPSNKRIKLKENKKIKKNYSFLNKTVFNKNFINNKMENNKNKKDKILFNNYMKEKTIHKNSSLIINKNCSESIKSNRLHHSNSTRKFNKKEEQNNNNKNTFKKVYINKFLKAFNNTIKTQKIFPITQREYKK